MLRVNVVLRVLCDIALGTAVQLAGVLVFILCILFIY